MQVIDSIVEARGGVEPPWTDLQSAVEPVEPVDTARKSLIQRPTGSMDTVGSTHSGEISPHSAGGRRAESERDQEGPRGTNGCACLDSDSVQCAAIRYGMDHWGEACGCLCHQWSDDDDYLG